MREGGRERMRDNREERRDNHFTTSVTRVRLKWTGTEKGVFRGREKNRKS